MLRALPTKSLCKCPTHTTLLISCGWGSCPSPSSPFFTFWASPAFQQSAEPAPTRRAAGKQRPHKQAGKQNRLCFPGTGGRATRKGETSSTQLFPPWPTSPVLIIFLEGKEKKILKTWHNLFKSYYFQIRSLCCLDCEIVTFKFYLTNLSCQLYDSKLSTKQLLKAHCLRKTGRHPHGRVSSQTSFSTSAFSSFRKFLEFHNITSTLEYYKVLQIW